MESKTITECFLSDPITVFKYLRKSQRFLLATNKSEIQLFCANSLKSLTNPMEFGVLNNVDLQVTADEQFLFVAYSSG
jgi:hypothetical protein